MKITDGRKAQASVRVAIGEGGAVSVVTGLSVLDHLVSEFARTASAKLTLEVAPGRAGQEAAAAGRSLGEAFAGLLRAPNALGRGFAWLPADEALAGAVVEVERAAAPGIQR